MEAFTSEHALHAVERAILVLLPALGLACFGLFAWRWRAVGGELADIRGWRGRLAGDFASEAPGPGPAGAAGGGERAATRLARAGLANAHLCPDALEKVLDALIIRERYALERGHRFLGTVGANGPFLGLTGTVLGILSAFRRMAEQGGQGGAGVMSAIAGALIATAMGLVVAIPAVVLFNMLKARVCEALDGLAELRNLMLARSLQASAKEAF